MYLVTVTTTGLTVGNYSFPTIAGAEEQVLKVGSSGNLVFGSGAALVVVHQLKKRLLLQKVKQFLLLHPPSTYIQVFINGVKTRPTTDFTTSGANVTLVSAATAGDHIDIVRFD